MKIFYCVRSLDGIPSCIYNIQLLKNAGYTVIPILGSASVPLISEMESAEIAYKLMIDPQKSAERTNFFGRIWKTCSYRIFVKAVLRENARAGDLVFVGTGDTILALYGALKGYRQIMVLKELYETPRYYQVILKSAAKKAAGIVCCENNRSRIIKARWNLNSLPYTLPNKPTIHPRNRNMEPSCDITSPAINAMKGRRIILYQARHIHFVAELENLAKALRSIGGDYLLVLVGTVDNPSEIKKVIDIYPQTYMTGHIPSPKHLEITSYAHIGVAVYQENSLNNLFCAPNKIFEYAGFGIPTLGNDVPGLVSTIGTAGAGACVPWDDYEAIGKAIQRIESDYAECSQKALGFFQNTDCDMIIRKIVHDTANWAIK